MRGTGGSRERVLKRGRDGAREETYEEQVMVSERWRDGLQEAEGKCERQ